MMVVRKNACLRHWLHFSDAEAAFIFYVQSVVLLLVQMYLYPDFLRFPAAVISCHQTIYCLPELSQIRTELEIQMVCNLREFKEFIDNEMIVILGQMDSPTEIFDHVFLVRQLGFDSISL